MDFVTHTLMSVGAMRIISPKKEWRPQLSLAAILGSVAQDADLWLFFLGDSFYGKYHRTISHTFYGLVLIAIIAAIITWAVSLNKSVRKFGWFVEDNLKNNSILVEHIPFVWFLLISLTAVSVHWIGDLITGFGNLMPFYPLSSWDPSLRLVNSFDWFIFSLTLFWYVVIRKLDLPKKKELFCNSGYFFILIIYLICRCLFCERTII